MAAVAEPGRCRGGAGRWEGGRLAMDGEGRESEARGNVAVGRWMVESRFVVVVDVALLT